MDLKNSITEAARAATYNNPIGWTVTIGGAVVELVVTRYVATIRIKDKRRPLCDFDAWVEEVACYKRRSIDYCQDPHVTAMEFERLSEQAAEAERLAAVDVVTLPGRLSRTAAAKAATFRSEAAYWRRLDKRAGAWARIPALAYKSDAAKAAVKLSRQLGAMCEWSSNSSAWIIRVGTGV